MHWHEPPESDGCGSGADGSFAGAPCEWPPWQQLQTGSAPSAASALHCVNRQYSGQTKIVAARYTEMSRFILEVYHLLARVQISYISGRLRSCAVLDTAGHHSACRLS